jgi:hypothetical protein
MMLMYGIELEQNPIARSIFHVSGPFGLIAANFGVVVSRVALLVRLARAPAVLDSPATRSCWSLCWVCSAAAPISSK